MGHWQEIEHTADLALHIWGTDLQDLFATAARGMFSLIADLPSISGNRMFELSLDALDAEMLLVDWLNELLYLNEREGVAFTTFLFAQLTPTQLQASVRGGPVTAYLNYIKAATFHNLAVVKTGTGYETEIVFDT